jgi:hypothetical protein
MPQNVQIACAYGPPICAKDSYLGKTFTEAYLEFLEKRESAA